MKTETATVTYKVPGTDKEFSKEYSKVSFETAEDVLAHLQIPEKASVVLDRLNYGYDLKVRAGVRNALITEVAGPETAIAKMAKSIIAVRASMGKVTTMERALELARKQMESMSDE